MKSEFASPKKWGPTRCTQETRESPKRDLCPSKSSLPNPKGTGHSRGHPKVNNPQGVREKKNCARPVLGLAPRKKRVDPQKARAQPGRDRRRDRPATRQESGQDKKASFLTIQTCVAGEGKCGSSDERPNGQTAPPDKHPKARTGGQVSPRPTKGRFSLLVTYLWLGLYPKESVALCQNEGIRVARCLAVSVWTVQCGFLSERGGRGL